MKINSSLILLNVDTNAAHAIKRISEKYAYITAKDGVEDEVYFPSGANVGSMSAGRCFKIIEAKDAPIHLWSVNGWGDVMSVSVQDEELHIDTGSLMFAVPAFHDGGVYRGFIMQVAKPKMIKAEPTPTHTLDLIQQETNCPPGADLVTWCKILASGQLGHATDGVKCYAAIEDAMHHHRIGSYSKEALDKILAIIVNEERDRTKS